MVFAKLGVKECYHLCLPVSQRELLDNRAKKFGVLERDHLFFPVKRSTYVSKTTFPFSPLTRTPYSNFSLELLTTTLHDYFSSTFVHTLEENMSEDNISMATEQGVCDFMRLPRGKLVFMAH